MHVTPKVFFSLFAVLSLWLPTTRAAESIHLLDWYPALNEGVVRPAQSPEFTVELANRDDQPAAIALHYAVRDFEGLELATGQFAVTVPANTEKEAHTVSLPGQSLNGFYAVELVLREGDRPAQKRVSSFIVTVPREKNDFFFGLNGIIMSDRMARPAAHIGVGSVALTFQGSTTYRGEATNFSGLDGRYEVFAEQGIQPVAMVWVTPRRAIPSSHRGTAEQQAQELAGLVPEHSERMFTAFGDFMGQAVTHFRGRIDTWEFGQEIDLAMHHGAGVLEHYVGLVRAGSNAARAANPEIILYGVGVSGQDTNRTPRHQVAREIWPRVEDYLDGMAFNSYVNPKIFGPGRHIVGPERGNFPDILDDAWSIMEKYGKDRLAIAEKGNAILTALPVDSPYAKDMAKVISRHLIVAKAMGVNRYMYFTVTGSRWHGNDDYGLWKREIEGGQYVNFNLHPRPAVATYATTAHLLAHTKAPAQRVELHDDIWIYVFERDSGSVLTLWSISQSPVPLDFEFTREAPVYDIMERAAGTLTVGRNRLVLSDAPLFVPVDLPATDVVALLEQAQFALPEVAAELSIADGHTVRLHLRNMTQDAVTASATIKGKTQTIAIEPAGEARLDYVLPGGVRSVARQDIEVTIASDGGAEFEFAQAFDPVFVPRLQPGTHLVDVQNKPPTLTLDSIDHIFPDDAVPAGLWTGPDDLSADLWFRWDASNFYMVLAVTDDVHVQNRHGPNIWQHDSIQFAFDTGNTALDPSFSGRIGYHEDDYEFSAALTQRGPQIYCHIAPPQAGMRDTQLTDLPLFSITRDEDTHITLYQIALPWETMPPFQQGIRGKAFGFNVCIPDSDDGRRASYWLGITDGILGGKFPSFFRTFILE